MSDSEKLADYRAHRPTLAEYRDHRADIAVAQKGGSLRTELCAICGGWVGVLGDRINEGVRAHQATPQHQAADLEAWIDEHTDKQPVYVNGG